MGCRREVRSNNSFSDGHIAVVNLSAAHQGGLNTLSVARMLGVVFGGFTPLSNPSQLRELPSSIGVGSLERKRRLTKQPIVFTISS